MLGVGNSELLGCGGHRVRLSDTVGPCTIGAQHDGKRCARAPHWNEQRCTFWRDRTRLHTGRARKISDLMHGPSLDTGGRANCCKRGFGARMPVASSRLRMPRTYGTHGAEPTGGNASCAPEWE
jgi:hypothetical protein